MQVIAEKMLTRFERYAEYVTHNLYDLRPRRVVFGIVDVESVGAFCYATPPDVDEPFDFVGINAGSIFVIRDAFARLCSDPQSFPLIGKPELEAIPSPMAQLSGRINPGSDFADSPRCPVRAEYAEDLCLVALDSLFFHEITHLRNGHLELQRRPNTALHWDEDPSDEWVNDDNIMRQALEMDADSASILHTLVQTKFTGGEVVQNLFRDIEKLHRLRWYGNIASICETVLLSTYLMFRIQDVEWNWDQRWKDIHPAPAFRMALVTIMLFTYMEERPQLFGWYTAETFVEDANKAVIDLEKALARAQGLRQPDLAMLASTFGDPERLNAHLDAMKAAWAQVRPVLETTKRGGNLP